LLIVIIIYHCLSQMVYLVGN